jgi:hypothetical protein
VKFCNRYATLSVVAAVGLFIKILANFPDFRVVVNNDKQGLYYGSNGSPLVKRSNLLSEIRTK